VALGADNFGSGLFLPLALVYVTRDVGLPLATAGTLVSAGTLAGLAAPPVAGRLADRIGPRPVVIAAQLLQAVGALTYLAARGASAVLAAAILLGAGQQLFYSSVFALISKVAGDGPKDQHFAVVSMIRSACFGLGGLAAGGLLTAAGPAGYRAAVAGDAASFACCALLLSVLVSVPRPAPRSVSAVAAPPVSHRVLANRPFLALVGVTGLIALATDFFLVGTPVFVMVRLHGPPWLPGTMLALITALSSIGGTAVLRATRRLSRIAAMQASAVLYLVWCAVSLAAAAAPLSWRPVALLAATIILSAAGLLCGPRGLAMAEESAPPAARGRYLATYQYAFTAAGVVAPALVALYSVAVWLPWLLTACAAGLAIASLRALATRLPDSATQPESLQPETLAEAA
jgi:MFS family permease